MNSVAGVPASNPISSTEAALYRRVTWRILPVLLVCYMLAYLDRSNIGFARLQMLSDLGFSESVYGFGAGVFFLGYALCEVPSNFIMHRFGARRWISRIMITWGTLCALMMFVSTPTMFYGFRLLLGVAEAGLLPGAILYLTYWYPARRRGQIIASFMAAVPFAGAMGGPLSGYIMRQMSGVNGWTGWQWLFLLEGLPTVVIGLFVFFYLDDHVRDAKWLSASEKTILAENVTEDGKTASHTSMWSAVRDMQLWTFCAIYFGILLGLAALSFWLPAIISSIGVKDNFHIGLLSMIPYGTSIVGMVLFGRRADARQERRWHMVSPLVIGAAGFSIIALGGNATFVMVGLTMAAVGVTSSMGLFWALPTAVLRGTAAAGGIGLISSAGIVAGFVSPYMIGTIKGLTHSIAPALFVHSFFLLLSAVLVITRVPARLVNK
ncbi:MFS transporter [Paraburkholderia steynii]|uniref:MFS transporter n=1 Tax=Paraburkholderia steynii TaxID=1245441 RepID=A0A4R0X9A5_9BURK|nr:MFS transporter [Paraburkholderia steynii]